MDAEDDIRKLTGEVSKVAFVALAGPLWLQTPTTRTASGICARYEAPATHRVFSTMLRT